MVRKLLLVSLFLSLLVACDKKEDDINPGRDYKGSLYLEYSRCFPTLNEVVQIDVTVNQSGVVHFAQLQPLSYSAESDKMIEDDRIKIREEGKINITSLSGKWIKADDNDYLQVESSFNVNGTHTTWKFDGVQWQQLETSAFTLMGPTDNPMLFMIKNAVRDGAVCGASTSDHWSPINFRWELYLSPSESHAQGK